MTFKIERRGMSNFELVEGDSVTAGMTHEISVNRDKSWIKYEVTSKVRPGESTDDARTRVIDHVSESVMQAVDTAIAAIRRKQ